LENFNIEIKFKIAVLCAVIGFLLGLTAVDLKDLAKSDDLGWSVGLALIFGIFGFSVLPMIIFEFAKPYTKLYLLCGPIGISFIKLAIRVFIADTKISKNEISKISFYMQKEFGNAVTLPLLDFIAENKRISEDLGSISKPLIDIRLSDRLDILYRLLSMVINDRMINDKEETILKAIAKTLKIGERRFEMVKNAILKEKGFHKKSDQEHQHKSYSRNFYMMDQLMRMAYNPYIILGIDQNASNDEVKKAYRNMVKKCHPDKSMLKNDAQRKQDAGKILEINEAYESIKKMRGIK
jgi:DnaJ like chaperone protein